MSKRSEIMDEINNTIDNIFESCHNVVYGDILDACCVANSVEQWLEQLRSEIKAYEDAPEEDE